MSWGDSIDEAYASVAANIAAFADIPGVFKDPGGAQRLRIRQIEVETPVELDLRASGDSVAALGTAPPVYRTETTIMPVFHTLRMTLLPDADLTADAEQPQ